MYIYNVCTRLPNDWVLETVEVDRSLLAQISNGNYPTSYGTHPEVKMENVLRRSLFTAQIMEQDSCSCYKNQ